MKKYYRITKDITLVDGENLSELKAGDIVFSHFNFPTDKIEKCTVLNKSIHLTIGLVKKNPEIFEEITEQEFEFQLHLVEIRNLLLNYSNEERNRIIDKLYKEFIPQLTLTSPGTRILPDPSIQPINPYTKSSCPVCGLSKNYPCGANGCPNRIQIWCSNSTNDIK